MLSFNISLRSTKNMKLATAILSVLAISSCSLATEASRTKTKDLENGAAKVSSRHLLRKQKKKRGEETTIANGSSTPPTGHANRIVTFNSKEERAAFLEADPDLTVHKIFKRGASIVITLTQEEAVAMLENETVKAIELDDVVRVDPIKPDPTDTPKGTASTQSETVPYGIDMVKALAVKDTNISAMTLCIADTGYDLGHEDLQTTNVNGKSFVGENWYEDGHGHGTHVAGTIAALQNNNKGVVGVVRNGNMNLLIAQVLDKYGGGSLSGIMEGFEWCADNGANIISASLGGTAYIQAFADLTKEIYEEDDVLIVAASGNNGFGADYPAFYDSVMSVAAVNATAEYAWFSTANSGVEIAAPGVDVLSAVPYGIYGESYQSWSGTSMACPHVSGIAALIWSHFPSKSARDIREALRATAEDLGEDYGLTGPDYYYGHGLVNAKAAFKWLQEGNTLSPTSAPTQCNGSTLRIEATTDYYADEIEWDVINFLTNEVILGSSYPWVDALGTFIYEACIPTSVCSEHDFDLYLFQVIDYWGDGGLEYNIKIDDVEIVSSGPNSYNNVEVVFFSTCGKIMQLVPSNDSTQALTPAPSEDIDLIESGVSRKLSKTTPKASKTPQASKAPKASKTGPKLMLSYNEFSMEQIWLYTPESYLMNAGLGMCLQGGRGGSLFLSYCEFEKYDSSKSFILAGFYDAVVSTAGRKLAAITLVDDSSVMLKEFLGPNAEGEPLKFEMDLSLGIIESYDVANAARKKN
ncbi:hypothetical protein CTEN210_00439 [Chaetoceros tenuissimus]|uniref:subtilisin n=1 Tax=Chaetoceros tenuissimus TaxID=426638 RepID=A0AAD3CG25_9STRA|nr:hypothetical protein CTEN210_00439 [Chaetoceros tenuissimus]